MGLPYIWNKEQTEATLDVAGDTVDVSWIHTDGRTRTDNYIIPNANQCKGCHKAGEIMTPIGPKARHLNRDFAYHEGTENQLVHWARRGTCGSAADPRSRATGRLGRSQERHARRPRPRLARNQLRPLPQSPKARHATRGSTCWPRSKTRPPSASTSLRWPPASARGAWRSTSSRVGPTNRSWSFGIASTHPGIMMPELGKRLVHEEGVALIRDWIAAMPAPSSMRAQPAGNISLTR